MKVFKGRTINTVYKKLVKSLLKQKQIGNTKEIENCTLIIKNPTLSNLQFQYRKISEKYSNAELMWYWSANNSCDEIGKYAKKWLSITDDGVTSNSAYGYILIKKYHKNQIEEVINLLKKDKLSRRAVLNISDPSIDRINTKDMQCTIALQFLIRNNKLNTTVYMRSNDVCYGLPYDYIYFMSIALYIAKQLNIEVGTYTHNATSLHIYTDDICKLKKHNQLININWLDIITRYYSDTSEVYSDK